MSLNKSIIKIRVALQNMNLKQSGKNKFAGFSYFELSDFLPSLNVLMLESDLNDRYYVKDEMACLDLIMGDEVQTYTIPYTQFMTPTNKSGQPSMQDIQYLGALNTYFKRYLYLNAFGITDGEIVDAMDNRELSTRVKEVEKISEAQLKLVNTLMSKKNVDRQTIKDHYKVTTLKDLPMSVVQAFIEYLEKL